jgi:hypothetical protein
LVLLRLYEASLYSSRVRPDININIKMLSLWKLGPSTLLLFLKEIKSDRYYREIALRFRRRAQGNLLKGILLDKNEEGK